MAYFDKNHKKIRKGDILHFEYTDGTEIVFSVEEHDGDLGTYELFTNRFISLAESCLEDAYLTRPFKRRRYTHAN